MARGVVAVRAGQLALAGDCVRVSNPRRPRASALPTSGLGLANLDERCRLLTGQALELERTAQHFEVRIPLVRPPMNLSPEKP